MANRPSHRKRISTIDQREETVNLIPAMNLFVILIPFLLFSAVFIQVGSIDTTLPIISEGGEGPSELNQRITITVVMNNLGFFVKGIPADPALRGKEKDAKKELASGILIRKTDEGKYSYADLTKLLSGIKQDYPKEDTVFLIPEPYVIYDDVVQTMDSARYVEEEKESEKSSVVLFENVILAAGAL